MLVPMAARASRAASLTHPSIPAAADVNAAGPRSPPAGALAGAAAAAATLRASSSQGMRLRPWCTCPAQLPQAKPTNVGHWDTASKWHKANDVASARKLRRDAGAKPPCCCDPAGASSSSFGGPRRQQGRSSSPAGKTQPPRATEDTRKNRCVLRTKPSAPLPRRCARKAGKSLHAVRRAQRGLQK